MAQEERGESSSSGFPGWEIFLFVCAIRVVNTFFVKTYFDPDEYWQTVEPAYCTVFQPDSKCAWTWEWTRRAPDGTDGNIIDQSLWGPARSFVSVVPTILFYKVLQLIGKDTTWFVSKGPHIFNAVFVAAPTDWLIAYSGYWLWGDYWPMFASLTSWFQAYSLVRSFANSQETLLLMAAVALVSPELYGLKSKDFLRRSSVAFLLGGISVAIRFTSLAAFVPLGLILAAREGSFTSKVNFLFVQCFLFGAAGLAMSFCVDRCFFGFWTIPFLGNFHFNVILDRASLYGAHPWHWYFTAGLPAISGLLLPVIFFLKKRPKTPKPPPSQHKPAVEATPPTTDKQERESQPDAVGVDSLEEIQRLEKELAEEKARIEQRLGQVGQTRSIVQELRARQGKAVRNLWIIVVSYVAIMSFNEHKEFRYIHPVLPLLCLIAGPQVQHAVSLLGQDRTRALMYFALPNLLVFFYLGSFHQLGAVQVNNAIVKAAKKIHGIQRPVTIHYLTGACHSTPLYSGLHSPPIEFDAWTLDCSPSCRADPSQICEYERFDADPKAYVQNTYKFESEEEEDTEFGTVGIPDFIVTLSRYVPSLPLADLNYVARARYPQQLQGVSVGPLSFGSNNSNSEQNILVTYPVLFGMVHLHVEEMFVYQRSV